MWLKFVSCFNLLRRVSGGLYGRTVSRFWFFVGAVDFGYALWLLRVVGRGSARACIAYKSLKICERCRLALPPCYNGPVNEIDDVAHILFVGQTGEAFLGERRNRAQVIGKLPEQFEPGSRLEAVAADNGFER